MWVLGIKPGSSGLAASTIIHWAVLPANVIQFSNVCQFLIVLIETAWGFICFSLLISLSISSNPYYILGFLFCMLRPCLHCLHLFAYSSVPHIAYHYMAKYEIALFQWISFTYPDIIRKGQLLWKKPFRSMCWQTEMRELMGNGLMTGNDWDIYPLETYYCVRYTDALNWEGLCLGWCLGTL